MIENFNMHPTARGELYDVLRYYGEIDLADNSQLAFDFEETFFGYVELIVSNPQLYNLRQHGIRRVNLLPRFGEFYIAYMIWHEKVVVLAIAHAKRRPYYWKQRIGEAKEMF